MSTCEAARPAPFRCPTLAEVCAAIQALLPRGRAWQSNEGGPISPIVQGFAPETFAEPPFRIRGREQSVLYGFWLAIAAVVLFVNERLCALRLEFWCATQSETHDLWMAEYDLPNDCDPFPDLCQKVAAVGGTRCEYYAAIAARAGWIIDCQALGGDECGDSVGSSSVGCITVGSSRGAPILIVRVHLESSLAYTGALDVLPYAGNFTVGSSLACDPDISPLVCVIERIVHAHVAVIYERV